MYNIFNYSGHRALWNWLAENPTNFKLEWPGWRKNGGKYQYHGSECFACMALDDDCEGEQFCPLDYGDESCDGFTNSCLGGLYGQWLREDDLDKKSKLALQIANLKPREGVEWE